MGAEGDPYHVGQSRSDMRAVDGPLFHQTLGDEDNPRDALLIGKSPHNQKHFRGVLDEIGIHAAPIEPTMISDVPARPRRMSPPAVAERFSRHYCRDGQFVSTLISLPDGATWDRFEADVDTPPGTQIRFDVLDESGKAIQRAIPPDTTLSDVQSKAIRLQAHLTSQDGTQRPVLRRWAVTWIRHGS